MGGAVSAGESNDELIDNLREADYIKSAHIEKVFRAVDRADYYLKEHRDSAYKDLAWKHGNLHMSAPCIYAEVLESLQLEVGMSFLNLGSGTGYLSTLAGLIIGAYGENHGIELHADVVTYARRRLDTFRRRNRQFDAFEFCEPTFCHGNCLLAVASGSRRYDRVYCGAGCPSQHQHFMKSLIKVGGILVMPLEDQLLQIRRLSETEWETKSVLPVSFALLVSPTKDNMSDLIELPEASILSLQEICRVVIRRILRPIIEAENPCLTTVQPRAPRPRSTSNTQFPATRRRRRVNIVPMSMGMMIMSQFDNSDDSDDDTGVVRRRPRGAPRDDEEDRDERSANDEENEAQGRDGPGRGGGRMSGLQDMLRQYALMQRQRAQRVRQRTQALLRGDDIDDDDHDEEEAMMEEEDDVEENHHKEVSTEEDDQGFEDAEENLSEMKTETKEALPDIVEQLEDTSPVAEEAQMVDEDGAETTAIPIAQGSSNRKRYFSSTSTSYTSSGIGTCSSVEEQIDFSREVSREEPTIEEIPEPIKVSAGVKMVQNGTENGAATKDTEDSSIRKVAEANGVAAAKEKDYSHKNGIPHEDVKDKVSQNNGMHEYNGMSEDKGTVDKNNERKEENELLHDTDDELPPLPDLPQHDANESMEYDDDSDSSGPDSDEEMEDADHLNDDDEEQDEDESESVVATGYSFYMHQKIDALPVPPAIKQYLMFYRT